MKTINETFTDEEHKKLEDKKGRLTWHDFILTLIKEKEGEIEKDGDYQEFYEKSSQNRSIQARDISDREDQDKNGGVKDGN